MVAGDADEGSILVEVNTAENTESCRISPGTDPEPWHRQFCCCSCASSAGRAVTAAWEELGLPQPGLLCDEQAVLRTGPAGAAALTGTPLVRVTLALLQGNARALL